MSTQAAEKEKTTVATEYVILQKRTRQNPPNATSTNDLPTGDYWVEVGKAKATNAAAAVTKIATSRPDPDGTYLAIPARSWVPRKLEVETRKVLHLT